jgi:hypothetical protein
MSQVGERVRTIREAVVEGAAAAWARTRRLVAAWTTKRQRPA